MAHVKVKLDAFGTGGVTVDGKPLKVQSLEFAASVDGLPVVSITFIPDEMEIDVETGELTQYVLTNADDFTPTKEQPFRKEIEPC